MIRTVVFLASIILGVPYLRKLPNRVGVGQGGARQGRMVNWVVEKLLIITTVLLVLLLPLLFAITFTSTFAITSAITFTATFNMNTSLSS